MKTDNINLLREASKIVAKVIAVFMMIVAIIMVMQYFQLKKIAPETSPLLPKLRAQLSSEPGNEALRERIRDFDLLSRRAWFTGQDQLRTGGFLLLGAGGVLLAAFIILGVTAKKRVEDESCPGMVETPRTGLRIAVALTGAGLFAGALAVAFVYDIGDNGEKSTAPVVVKKVTAEEFYANWPGFRGPDARGVVPEGKLFTDWDITLGHNLLWKTKIPLKGFSSPIVWQNKIFVTGGDKKKREIYCYDANNGKLLWQHNVTGISGSPIKPPKVTSDTGYAASTPATDGHRVFAIFATGDLVCTDFDGKRIWAKNLGVPENPYGYSSSLLTTPDKLIVQYDDERRQLLLAFDSASGRELWRKQRKAAISWSSPVKIDLNNSSQIVILTCASVEAYDLETGKQLWRENCMAGEVATSACFAGGRVLVANDNAVAAAIDPVKGEVLWENDEIDLPDVSSPIGLGDMMFIFTSGGVVECVGADAGKKLWEHTLSDGFYSSPVLVGNRIIAIDMKGVAHIIIPDKKQFIQERTCKVGEMVVATPVPGKNKLWLRGVNYLYCVGKRESAE